MTLVWIWQLQTTSPFEEASSTAIPSVDKAPTKKEKKKKTVCFSLGGLVSDSSHFDDNSTIDVLTETPIPYTQMELFLYSACRTHGMVGNRVYGFYPCACDKKGISEKLLSSFRKNHWMIDSA